MNKAIALVFLATFAIAGISVADANKHHQKWLRPGLLPWIPLNIPVPRPQTGTGTGTGTTTTCPTAPNGCTKCGTAAADKCTAGDGEAAQGPCFTGPCPAACVGTACVQCATGCTP